MPTKTATGMVFCHIFYKYRHNYYRSCWEHFPLNCLASTSVFLMQHREVEKDENNATEGQTPSIRGLFSLASPLSSPLVILDPVVSLTLETLMVDCPIVHPLPGSLWTRWSNGPFPSHYLRFCLYTVLHSLFPFPSPSANWDWLRGGLKENELSLKLSAALSHSYKRGSHMASAPPAKPSLSKCLDIQDVHNTWQKAGLSAHTCPSKHALLLKDACSLPADTHRHPEPSEASALQEKQLHCPTSFHKAGGMCTWGFVWRTVRDKETDKT